MTGPLEKLKPQMPPHTGKTYQHGASHAADAPTEPHYQNQRVEYIPLSMLIPMENQPRQVFDQSALEELAQSIRTYGILQPLIVTVGEQQEIFIIAGERRWRAAKIAGLASVPCLLRHADDHSRLELALIENIQREELSALEESTTLRHLMEEHAYTQEALANRLGKSRAAIANSLRLLNLPQKIKESLAAKTIMAGHARALCALENEKIQLKVHQLVVLKKLSVRQTEDFIRNYKKEKEPKKLIDHISPDLRYVCDQFKGHLGTKVKIAGDTHKGKIEISYYNMDDLERISEIILGNFGLGEKK